MYQQIAPTDNNHYKKEATELGVESWEKTRKTTFQFGFF